MKRIRDFLGQMWICERGQALVLLAVGITAFIGLAGVSIETAHAYYAYEQLEQSTNAAALAGAQALPNQTLAVTYADQYSSATISGVAGLNSTSILTNAQLSAVPVCSTTVSTTLKIACLTPSGVVSSSGTNAMKVTQTASVPSWFAGMFGIKTFNLSYSAMAAMNGGMAKPWNIAIILDTTNSMSHPDSGNQCSGTQISCALKGVQSLLENMYPCEMGQTCASGTPVDSVSLYVFPPVLASTAGKDYCSGGSGNPTHEYYEVPTLPNGTNSKTVANGTQDWTYQIITYSNDYQTSDSATLPATLNPASNIVIATGYTKSCSGIQAPGGAGTYYAQVITQAASDLATQKTNNPGSQNAMIILSDGDATACATNAYTSGGACSSASDLEPSATNSLNGLTTNTTTEKSYTYASALGECGQAVQAAQTAASNGVQVFTIGYGAETSGCASDATYSASISTPNGTWQKGGSPCQALADMASAADNFYSDDGDGCQATTSTNTSVTQLTAIFQHITEHLTSPRLIPPGSN
jgi:Flp pilus assembly protein TadG